jgi:hypothetical protein
MFLDEMNDAQRAEIEMFEERLERADWDLEPIKSALHSGSSVSPEGCADFVTPGKQLALDLYVDERALLLTLEFPDRFLQFRIEYENLGVVLDWLIRCQQDLDPRSFATCLRQIIPYCKEVVYLTSDGKRYKLTVDSDIQDLGSRAPDSGANGS